MGTILSILGVARVAGTFLAAALQTERGDEINYWRDHSVVVARVASVRSSDDDTFLDIRPLATLSGSFDAGTEPELPFRWIHVRGLRRPGKGETIVVVIRSLAKNVVAVDPQRLRFGVAASLATFMPRGDPVSAVFDDSDADVESVLAVVQERRHIPGVNPGRGVDYWRENSIIAAQVLEVHSRNLRFHYYLRPLGTLSGDFDAALNPLIVAVDGLALRDEFGELHHSSGVVVLVVVRRTSDGNGYVVTSERTGYMPHHQESMTFLKESPDADVTAVLKRVQEFRANEGKP